MKSKVLLFLIGLCVCIQGFSQVLTVTFTAELNDQHLPMDSIWVQNLTQIGDTMLYPPDTILVLGDVISSIDEFFFSEQNDFKISQNYPNPLKGSTNIDLYLPENETVLISVSDHIGRDIIQKQLQLESGNHIFSFTPANSGIYLLSINVSGESETIKMINTGVSTYAQHSRLDYNGKVKSEKKRNSSSVFMKSIDDYDLGDQLSFTAFTEFGNMTLIDAPVVDQTYTFDFNQAGIPCPDSPTIIDIQGNVYNTVLIGSDCWMKENLRTTAFNNEVMIPNYQDEAEWEELTTPAYVWYDNDINWAEEYGALYNGYVFVNEQNVCPTGWHPSTHDNWLALFDYIGGTDDPFGNQLKSCRQEGSPLGGSCDTSEHPRWNSDLVDYGTDDYGFSAVPAGRRVWGGPGEGPDFDGIGITAYWWTDLENNNNLQTYYLHNEFGFVAGSYNPKYIGISIRCVKD